MTQEKNPAASPSDAAPAKAPAQAKKTRSTTRKTPARKTIAPKAVAAEAPEDAAAPKKPRAAAKAKHAAKPATDAASASPVTEPVKNAAKPVRAKAPVKPRPAKPKTAAPKAAVSGKAGEKADDAGAATKPAAEEDAKKTRAAGRSKARAPVKTEKAAPAEKAAPKGSVREKKEAEASPAPVQPVTPEPSSVTGERPEPAQASPEENPKPAPSRRSRRGGRRRNKSKAAAAEQADAPAAAPEGKAEPAPEGKPAPKDEARKDGSGGRTAVKTDAKASPAKAETAKTPSGKRKMFISVLSGELVEVVLAEEGQVVEYYVEMQHQAKVKGNIYKGVVSNIDANLQAAFISYAPGVKNGFLQIDEVHPEYYQPHHDPIKGRKYPPIQKVLKPGQEILVQVVKEPAGTKGAFLTSYLSLPGRFLVLTPGREQIGVSRKVDSDDERSRLRGLFEGLAPGAGLGVIVRTVSSGASKTSLQRDLQFLKRLWKEVRGKGQSSPSPSLIYEELDLSTRAIRDYLTDDVQEVWIDDATTARQVAELASLLFPKKQNLVQVHHDAGHSLFERFSLQKQLDQIHSREVALPSGGRLVIDNTEALTAIDINSGRSGGKNNFEDMAFRTNVEAAKAIPLQLRLRDIGGQVVVDFIEMRDRGHWREVEKAVRNGMKGDRARYDVGKVGPFGMLEIVRQRLGSSAISISTEPCPCCKGTGIRRNMEWQAMQALRDVGRMLRQAAANSHPALTFHAEPELAFYLLNAKRTILQNMEEESGVSLAIRPAGE